MNTELVRHIPTATQMGKVYTQLIIETMHQDENFVDGMIRTYNSGEFYQE